MSESIGFIGTGIMGQPMALNLLKSGHKVAVYNRTKAKTEALERAGARVAATPGEAARGATFVMTIVSDSAAAEEVVLGKGGILETIGAGAVLVDSSTISPSPTGRPVRCQSARLAAANASQITASITFVPTLAHGNLRRLCSPAGSSPT